MAVFSNALHLTAAVMVIVMTLILEATITPTAVAHREKRRGGVVRRQISKTEKEMNMVFYMHDIPTATHPTSVMVAAQKGQELGKPPFKLGTTFVFDDKLTEGPNPHSTQVGRGQGLFTLASLTNFDLLLVFTAVFHRPAHFNGSTICFHGSDRIFVPDREIGVVGGTGVFRFARGYAVMSTVSLSGLNAVLKFNVTMRLA